MNAMDNTGDVLYTVGEVAKFFHISVRTLHYWESCGLLTPHYRSWSNYRLYDDADCKRVERILIYRATGMKLADIQQVLDTPASDVEHLVRQRKTLLAQKGHIETMLAALDTLLEDAMEELQRTPEAIGELLHDAHFATYEAEAKNLYAETTDWQVYQHTTAQWKQGDWATAHAAIAQVERQLAQAAQDGVAPDSSMAHALVQEHRKALSVFYPVTAEKHYLLSRSYITDARFQQHYDALTPGLAQWLADAIAAAAVAHGIDLSAAEWK